MPGNTTRQRILQAAVHTLATTGYANTTARAIARTGRFAPGVIYYHFTDLDDMFVAVMQFTSQARLDRYRTETSGVTSAAELLRRLRRLYIEDQTEHHIAAVQELVAAAAAAPRLAEQVRAETTRWQDLAEDTIRNLLAGTSVAPLIPVPELATAVVAAYLGVEMLSHLNVEHIRPGAIFDVAEHAADLFDAIVGAQQP